jgi:epoxyqueuosine reductase
LAPGSHPQARSVVMIAKPRAAHLVRFDLRAGGGGMLEAILPPTYHRYRTVFEEVRQDLALYGLPGAHLEPLQGPHKAVAARLGLVRYGKNNVTYVPGTGSYHQLCGYVTDAVLAPGAPPAGSELLPDCRDCRKCLEACPTRAIREEPMLLRAERCLTQANENPGPWPEWVPGRAHHCLVGCLICQRVCPANPKLAFEDTGIAFSAAETESLLDGSSRPQAGLLGKLEPLVADYLWGVLGRNLAALARLKPVPSAAEAPARNGSSPA